MSEDEEMKWLCDCCYRERTGEDEQVQTLGEHIICEDCAEDHPWVFQCGDNSCDNIVLTTKETYYFAGDTHICQECRDERYFECSNCGEIYHQDYECYNEGLGSMCDTCYEELVRTCERCNEAGMTEDMHDVGELGWHCEACAVEAIEEIFDEAADCNSSCSECADRINSVLGMAVSLGVHGFRSPFTCVDCGRDSWAAPVGNPFDIVANIIEGEDHCYSCCSRETGRGYRVLNYSAKPPPKFKSTQRDLQERALHFGTEVELELAEDHRRNSALIHLEKGDTERIFYCKDDSSIENGFELVTHPFTFDWMKENGQAFEVMFSLSSMMTGWDSEDCGMHIHMSANAFTNLQLFKFMRFFYMNREYIERLSRRRAGKMERWAGFPDLSREQVMRFAIGKREDIRLGRGALNFSGRSTIECRVFRSTLSPTVYYGNIEFLQSLFDYTKNCGADDSELTVSKYLDFTSGRAKAFKNFLTLNELIPDDFIDEMEV